MSYYDDASLMFLAGGGAQKDGKAYSIKPTDGTGDFTFSRGSNLAATRVDADGLIEKGRENLLLYSQEFDNSYYGKSLGTLTANQTTAPNGSLTADLFTKTSAVNSVSELKKSSPIYASIGVHTYSVYVKQNVGDNVLLRLDSSGNTASALFTFSTKSINPTGSNVIDATATELSDGWFRLSVTGNVTSTSWSLSIATLYANPTNDSVFVWGAQLEQSLAATEYIETTTTTGTAGVLEDTPRFDYSNGASCPSLLLEPSRTNLIKYSEYFGGWNNQSSDTTLEIISSGAPDGGAFYRCTSGATGSGRIKQSYSTPVSGAVQSIYAKGSGTIQVNLWVSGGANVWNNVTLTSEWTRYDVYNPQAGPSGDAAIWFYPNGVADIWGAQVESGSYPTSYIPTYGTSQTRAADVCGGAGDANTFNDSEGVLYAEVAKIDVSAPEGGIFLRKDTSNEIRMNFANNNRLNVFVNVGGVNQVYMDNSNFALEEYNKVAIKYKVNDYSIFVNGIKIFTDTNASVPSGINEVKFNQLQGNVKQVLTFNTVLSDADLATLTTI